MTTDSTVTTWPTVEPGTGPEPTPVEQQPAMPNPYGMDLDHDPAPPPSRPEHDSLAAALDDVREFASRFIAYPSRATADAHALWIAHAHIVDAFENTPRLAFLSPEPGSGKSRAMEITEALVPRPVLTVNATVPYVFRKISDPDGLPTLLMDEADAVFSYKKADGNEDLRGLLNSGYRKGATTGRVTIKGKELIPEEWPSFCAVALAGLNDLPDTLMTRSIIVPMKKRRPDQVVRPYRRRRYRAESELLRERVAEQAETIRYAVGNAWPDLPEGIDDRDADIWEPLIAIADAAGEHWPATARAAAVTLVEAAKAKPQTLGVKLLADVRALFEDRDAMSTADLLHELIQIDASPWASIKGEPITARFLAQMLAKYDVPTNNTVRVGARVVKGYRRDHLFDAWARYLPPLPPKVGNTSNTSNAAGQDDIAPVTPEPVLPTIGYTPDQALPNETALTRDVTAVTDVTEFQHMKQAPDAPTPYCQRFGCTNRAEPGTYDCTDHSTERNAR